MKQTVSVETRRELCAAIAVRYRAADRKSKKLLLYEFVKITGYHRKHAIRLLRKGQAKMTVKSVSKQIYDVALEEALIVLWEAADRRGYRKFCVSEKMLMQKGLTYEENRRRKGSHV